MIFRSEGIDDRIIGKEERKVFFPSSSPVSIIKPTVSIIIIHSLDLNISSIKI